MIYVCGTDRDYDSWAAMGNNGWEYNNVLPLFKLSETNTDRSRINSKNRRYHGIGGSLTVSSYGSTNPYVQVLKDAFNQTGYKFLRDFNSQDYNGLVETQVSIKEGERCSAAKAFLLPIESRPNLSVMQGSVVEKILFNGNKAIGVNVFTKSSDNLKFFAKNEIIIAAGALSTPKILLKSGIGRSNDLTPFNISQVKNLAVGENFQDHVKSFHFIKINPNATIRTLFDFADDAIQYFDDRSGPFSNLNIMNYNAFINTTDPNAQYPDAHYMFYLFAKSHEFLLETLYNFGFKENFIQELYTINQDFEIIMVFNNLANPVSTGTVKLRSKNEVVFYNIKRISKNDIFMVLRYAHLRYAQGTLNLTFEIRLRYARDTLEIRSWRYAR